MTREKRDSAIGLLVTMVVQDRADRESRPFSEVFSEFRRSDTYAQLFDPKTGLWMNGPDYISDEYDLELQRKQHSITSNRA